MDLTPAASWLNSTFDGFDRAVSGFAYALHAGPLGRVLDPFLSLITRLGDHGLFFVLLSLALIALKRTRRIGCVMLLSVVIGTLINNIALKNIIARPRPYTWTDGPYHTWWQELGSHVESEFSFPSGHSFVSCAALLSLALCLKGAKRWLWLIPALLIAFSRVYLFVHYPTDVIAGLITGASAALIGYALWPRIEKALRAKWPNAMDRLL